MEPDPQVQEHFTERLKQSEDDRRQVLDRYANEDWANLATVEQTVNRFEQMQQPDMAKEYLRRTKDKELTEGLEWMGAPGDDAEIPPIPDPGELVLEKIIGQSEIMPIRFIHDGSRIARSIGRIVFRTQRRANGTGFLVSPGLLLTNFHVLRDMEAARSSIVQFDYLARSDGSTAAPVEFDLQPDRLFLQNPIADLDCALVAVEPVNEDGVELDRFGFCTLIGQVGKEHPGERVNVIHHPGGSPKQVSLRENFVAAILEDYLHYMTDTAPGSSGSPVFNDEWQVVALHHASKPITDQAEIDLYRAALGSNLPAGVDEDATTITVNEGARISQVVAWLATEAGGLAGEARQLVDEALAHALEATPSPNEDGQDGAVRPGGGVTINITVGGDGMPAITTSRSAVAASDPGLELFRDAGDRNVMRGLAALQARREGPYLPSKAVQSDRINEYYGDLPDEVAAGDLSDSELYDALHARISEAGGLSIVSSFPQHLESLESFHRAALDAGMESLEAATYDRSRAHLYTWVDLHPDRMLHCIYTDALIAPEQLMLKDLAVSLGMGDELPQRFKNNQFLNCEHVVPQSWFDKEAVAKADLHHLFTADGAANNYRSDSVYQSLTGDNSAVEGPADLPEYIDPAGLKATGPKRFEPHRSKSTVARATLYFLVAHKGKVDGSKIDQATIDLLIEWSDLKEPNRYERHRNESISEIQFNRNPLIDFPEWVHRIDFAKGVAAA